MKFEDAVKKSIKGFLAGKSADKTSEDVEGGLYYTQAFFDEFEEKFLVATDDARKNKKSKKSKKGDDSNEV
tara:strand:+ start:660 stop:872 length:213 start_codon:yes stop_codon:yes gene_type:complete